jgi:hypothetical protein
MVLAYCKNGGGEVPQDGLARWNTEGETQRKTLRDMERRDTEDFEGKRDLMEWIRVYSLRA